MTETDRTRIITYQSCPRQRFLGFHIHGKGLQRKSKSLPLQFGSAFHEGSGVLLGPDVDDPPLTPAGRIDAAVLQAHWFLQDQFDKSAISFDNEENADIVKAMEYGREEQMALAEALLRGWWAYEGPSFLESFEVIEVEQEGRATLSAGHPYEPEWQDMGGGPPAPAVPATDDLVLMFRPDALVRDKASGDLYVISWKTCSKFDKRTQDQARHDQQSMSEVWGLEASRAESDVQK